MFSYSQTLLFVFYCTCVACFAYMAEKDYKLGRKMLSIKRLESKEVFYQGVKNCETLVNNERAEKVFFKEKRDLCQGDLFHPGFQFVPELTDKSFICKLEPKPHRFQYKGHLKKDTVRQCIMYFEDLQTKKVHACRFGEVIKDSSFCVVDFDPKNNAALLLNKREKAFIILDEKICMSEENSVVLNSPDESFKIDTFDEIIEKNGKKCALLYLSECENFAVFCYFDEFQKRFFLSKLEK